MRSTQDTDPAHHIDIGEDAPPHLYLCLPDRIVLIVNTSHPDNADP